MIEILSILFTKRNCLYQCLKEKFLSKERLLLKYEHPLYGLIFVASNWKARREYVKYVLRIKYAWASFITGHFYLTNEHGQDIECPETACIEI